MLVLALAVVLIPLIRAGRRHGRSRGIFVLILAIAFVLPLGASALYLLIGTPAALNGVSASAQPPLSMAEAIDQLRAHLKENPDDLQGWLMLAQTSTMQHDLKTARDAFDHVLKLDANNTQAMVGWAESDSMLRPDHLVTGRAQELLKRAVLLQPDSQRGLWLLGISQFQQGNYADAAATWRLLQPQLEPGSAVAKSVATQIGVADARAGGAPASSSSTTAAATAPKAASLQVEVSLAPALKDKLAPGDTLFVYARAPNGPPMPLAVARLNAAQLPAKVTLDDAMAMTPSRKLSSVRKVFVGARITHSGQPLAQAGDLEGDAGVVSVNDPSTIKITIDKVH